MTNQTILVVDDTSTILKLTKNVFEIAGYDVVTAVDGEIAMAILKERKIDLVITDILMPNMDGYVLCYTIRTTESIKNIPIIIYSATYTSSSDEEMAMELGADQFIRKPAAMHDLVGAAQHLLSNARNYIHAIPEKPKLLEATQLYNEGLVNKLERRNKELEEATKKIEQSEARLKEAQMIAHIGHWQVTLADGSTTWSDEIYRIYGTTREETSASIESFLSFIHPDEASFISEKIKQTLASGKGESFTARFIKKDGAIRHSYTEWKFEFNNDNIPIRLYGITQDITEKKEAEEQREFDRNNLYSLINNTNDVMWSVDKDLKLVTSNQAFDNMVQAMSGRKPEKGASVLNSSVTEEQIKSFKARYQRALSGEAFTETEHSDFPQEFWSEISFNPIRKDGEVIGTACFARDITEKKQQDEKLRNSEQRFRALIENSAEGISLTDEFSKAIYRSPAVKLITGSAERKPDEITLANVHPEDSDMMRSRHAEVIGNPGIPVPFQARFLHTAGHYYWLEGTMTNLLHLKGVNAIVSNFRDISKRKIAEQALLESNERYGLVSKATSDAIWDWDVENNVTTWNHGLKTLFGYEDQKITDSLSWWEDKIHPDDYDRVWSEIDKCFRTTCESWVSSYRYKTIDGNYRHVFDRARIVYRDKKAVRMIGAMQDVDDRVKSLEEVKRLSIVASKTDNAVLILKPDAGIEWVNESFTLLSGYTLSESVGKKPYELLHGPETDRSEERRIIEKLNQLRPYTDEILNYAKDGRKYWVRITVTPVFNENGELDKFVTIQSDITVQKEFEKNLTTIARELTGFIENANATIVGVDRNGYISEWNKVTAQLIGFTRDEVLGKKWTDFLGAKVKSSMLEVLGKVYTGESVDNYELPIVNKEGKRLILSISISPRFDVNKKIAGAICVGQDVTEVSQYRQNLERMVEERTHDLNEALKKEKELVEMKNKFVSIASHEFRTPLATIRFAADSIRNYFDKLSTEEILKKIDKIQEQSIHMNNLLEDILTIGKSDARKIKVVTSSINLKEFIETLVEEVKATQKVARKVVFTFTCENALVSMDDKLLRNIIINLLTNAIKFSADDTTVAIAVSDIDDRILVEVTDEGIGIKEDELGAVFESFQRGSNVAAVQGTGLGLSIVKKAVELMGGSIKVESVVDKGSSFKIQLAVK